MKKIILCFLLMAGFTVQAQQLSPNFYNQFKTILTANWEGVKGNKEVRKEDKGNGTIIIYYNSKEKIDGCKTLAVDFGKYKGVLAFISPGNNNVQLFEQILSGLYNLKSEGYEFQDITNEVKDDIQSLRMNKADKVFAVFTLYKSNYIKIITYMEGVPLPAKKSSMQ